MCVSPCSHNHLVKHKFFVISRGSERIRVLFVRRFITYHRLIYGTCRQFELVGIPRDEEGMNLENLEQKLAALKKKPTSDEFPFTAAVYVIPVFHNPTTRNMSSGKLAAKCTYFRSQSSLDLVQKFITKDKSV